MQYRQFGLMAGILCAAFASMPPPALAEDSASAEIDQRGNDPNQWPAPGRDNKLTRHSKLKEITTENVTKLGMIWAQSTGRVVCTVVLVGRGRSYHPRIPPRDRI